MNNKEAKKLVDNIFYEIERTKNIQILEGILDRFDIPDKFRMNSKTYPKIDFKISPEDITQLKISKILSETNDFNLDISAIIDDPLSKLLYALAWKNGDLKKIRHIIEGINNVNNDSFSKDDGLVFYQFGKYLTKSKAEPIIDQHVLRAFGVYVSTSETINYARSLSVVGKKHKDLIDNYKKWLISDNLTEELMMSAGYSYYIDKILFAVGKMIKPPSKKKS